jgi:hypothetical protein
MFVDKAMKRVNEEEMNAAMQTISCIDTLYRPLSLSPYPFSPKVDRGVNCIDK